MVDVKADGAKGSCKCPMGIEQQVRLVAGVLIILTLVLASWLSYYFLWITFLVGAALIYSGVTGCCKLGECLEKMPWNKEKSS